MIISLEKALNIVGERSADSYRQLKQARRQRRTEYTDIYGVPFESETDDEPKLSEFHLSISPDLEYWERFQFKLRVVDAATSFNENEFTIKIIEISEDEQELSSGDLSPYLKEQHGLWIDDNGFYPTEEISDEGADAEDFFDILDACTLMWEEGKKAEVKRILNGGTKLIRIRSPIDCKVTFIPYIKYSTVNR